MRRRRKSKTKHDRGRLRTAMRELAGADGRDDHRGGADPFCAAFEQGPFQSLPVPEVPPGVLTILRRVHGSVDPAVLETYERARLFAGYEGPELTDRLRTQQWLSDPHHLRQADDAKAPKTAPMRHAPADDDDAYDELDLGD